MAERAGTGILGFDQRVQYTVKDLPYIENERDEAAGLREHKNFVRFYTAIRVRLSDFTDVEKKTEITGRLETARKTAIRLGEYGLRLLTFSDTVQRGAQVVQKQGGKAPPLGTDAERERAAARFEAEFCRTETRALAFLRAFEGMAELFDKSADDEEFLTGLEEMYPLIK